MTVKDLLDYIEENGIDENAEIFLNTYYAEDRNASLFKIDNFDYCVQNYTEKLFIEAK